MTANEPSIGVKTSYHHGDLKAQLVEAVRQLVEEKGPDGFSVSEASRRAGVSTAAPYKHFRDKSEILKAVIIDGMERLEQHMVEAAEALPQGSLARIDAIGQSYIDFARAEPGVFRLVFGLAEDHDEDPDLMARGQSCFEVILAEVAAYLGVQPDDPVVFQRTYMLWTFVHGHSFLVIDGKTAKKGQVVDEAAYLAAVSRGVLDSVRAVPD